MTAADARAAMGRAIAEVKSVVTAKPWPFPCTQVVNGEDCVTRDAQDACDGCKISVGIVLVGSRLRNVSKIAENVQ